MTGKGNLIICCVRVGTAYDFRYVTALRNMVARHMSLPYEMVCLTDQPERCDGVTFIDCTAAGLPGWWAKLLLFERTWRNHKRVIYFDLDTVIIGDPAPLADVPGEFAILESPVRRLMKKHAYPCKYNSSVMVLGAGMAGFVWDRFEKHSESLMQEHARYGDQACIEALYPDAPFLQDLLPDFFCNYRQITAHPPKSAVVNFAGNNKPHNCPIEWVQQAWS